MTENMRRFSRIVGLFHALGGASRVFRHREHPTSDRSPLAAAEEEVLELCGARGNGARLGEIVEECTLDEEDTLVAVSRLVDRGVLEHA
jgi:hypothetical protein